MKNKDKIEDNYLIVTREEEFNLFIDYCKANGLVDKENVKVNLFPIDFNPVMVRAANKEIQLFQIINLENEVKIMSFPEFEEKINGVRKKSIRFAPGDIITLCDGRKRLVQESDIEELEKLYDKNFNFRHYDQFDEKFANAFHISSIERPIQYKNIFKREENKEKNILTQEERDYLSSVIKPVYNDVLHIFKYISPELKEEYIKISIRRSDGLLDYIGLSSSKKGTNYKGMEPLKEYTKEELGL